tara:strand:- start:291 stop:560 length:270 start_codon:yes stop_codon:yes gene_type:complete
MTSPKKNPNGTEGITPHISETLKEFYTLFDGYKDQLTYDEDGICDTCKDCVWDGFIEWFNNDEHTVKLGLSRTFMKCLREGFEEVVDHV